MVERPANGRDDDGNGYVDDCHGIDLVDDDGVPLDPRQHGTHVAGIIGARGNNGIGVSGVAWDVRMVACRFINSEGAGQIADAIECLDYAAGLRDRGINVVATNNSWGGGPPSRALDDAVRAHRGDYVTTSSVGRSWSLFQGRGTRIARPPCLTKSRML